MNGKRVFPVFLVIEIAALLSVTTLTYLPNLTKATIYRDDWYYMVDRVMGGPQTYHQMFRIDRPARAYIFEAYYRLFGVAPAPYHAASFAWRLLLGLAALWLFSLLWPGHRQAVLLIALLFIIYPGYTRWMEGVEDQPKVISLFLQVISYALTLQAARAKRVLPRVASCAGSILTGWGYLALVDYAMGMEAFRFLCVLVLVNRDRSLRSWKSKGGAFLCAAAPGLLALGGFLYWRVFVFQNLRSETDIKLQLSKVIDSPASGLAYWFTHFLQSIVNEAVVAWGGYGMQDFFKLAAPQFFAGLLTALAVTACALLGFIWLRKIQPENRDAIPGGAAGYAPDGGIPWQREAIWIGLLGVIAGVAPVVLANRAVEFGILSHYGLPASLAAATLLGGLVFSIASERLRLASIAALVLLAVATQYAASVKVANEEEIVGKFWHQVAWRAPGIREATGLMVYYPSVPIGEDVDFVHGPANFLYFLQPTESLPVRYKLFAIKQYPYTIKEFIAGGKVTDGYRSHYGVVDYGDYGYILAISQPAVDSCVHIIDRRWPWYSFDDPDSVLVLGQNSNIRNVLANAAPLQVPEKIFGPEPEHGWCYYFEKADLALQQGDLQAVAVLANEAARLGLAPNEPLEWMPFLQAYAQTGDERAFAAALSKINTSRYNQVQACGVLDKMQQAGIITQPAIQRLIQERLCP